MRAKLGRIAVLAGVSAAIVAAGAPTAGAAEVECGSIVGAGSSLQKVAQQNVWIPGFTNNTTGGWKGLCKTSPSITYNSTSSGKGKTQWGYENEKLGTDSPFEAYIGTDLAPSLAQIEHMGKAGEQPTPMEGVMSVPVAQSAISVVVSLPTNCKPKAGETEAKVSVNKLNEEWETGGKTFTQYVKEIECSAASNPNLKVRSSNSGTTAGYKRFFDTLTGNAAPWKALTETPLKSEEPNWPATLEGSGHLSKCCEKGSEVAHTVLITPGTSGYADLADARNEGFAAGDKWVEHENSSAEKYWSAIVRIETTVPSPEEYVSPEESGGGSNCKKAKYEEEIKHLVAPGEDWSGVKQENVKENGSYPICTLTFDLAWNKYETPALEAKYGTKAETEEKRNTVLNYFSWIVSKTGGQNSELTTKNYGLLPTGIREKAETGVKSPNIE